MNFKLKIIKTARLVKASEALFSLSNKKHIWYPSNSEIYRTIYSRPYQDIGF